MAAIQHVGIVGAGLAGLSAALAAARAGVRVQVFEAQPRTAEPAAHLDVVPNLLRDLAALGVAEACVRRGFPHQGFAVLDAAGRPQFEQPAPRLAGSRWPATLGMVYGDLLATLRDAALAHGATLHTDCAVRDADEGGAIVTTRGERFAVDLAVVATGENLPAVAGRTPEPVPAAPLPQQWCHALLSRPPALDRASWIIGRGALQAMLVPVDARRVGVALLQEVGTPAAPVTVRASLAAQGPLLQALALHWTDDTPTLLRPVRCGVLAGPWHAGGALRIGHSAHRLPPHFGQAAAQVVEDACVLGDLLRTRPDRSDLLHGFMARRGERTRRVLAITAQAARWQLRPEAATDLPGLALQLAPLVAEPA